jgi:histidinol-phosphate aminotransferase
MGMQSRFPSGVKKMKIEELVRKEVFELPLYEVKRVLDQTLDKRVVKLDLNENFAAAIDVMEFLLLDACREVDVRLYPPPYGGMVIKAISDFLGFSESEISVGNGADEVLDLLMKVFMKKGSKVLVVEPTFSMYDYFTQLYGGRKVTVLLRPNFELDIDAILKKADKETQLLVLCSPNNPTGNQFKKEDIKRVLQEFNGVVVVDEAYVDFAGYTVIEWVKNSDKLVVLRTSSKALGLAGIRFGFLVTNRSIVKCVKRVTSPFNVNIVTQRLIALALENWNYFKERIQYVIGEREWLRNNLAKIDGITPYPSDANFILFKVAKNLLASSTVAKRLENRNVLVKDRGNLPLLKNCIRVTVGTRGMNKTFLSALEEALEE